MHPNDIRFLSEPVGLEWLGWKTDTKTLAQYGWEISADQSVANHSMQIAIRFKGQQGYEVKGFTMMDDWHYQEIMHRQMNSGIRPEMRILQMQMAHNLMISSYGEHLPSNFFPIDARPSITSMNESIYHLEDFAHFKKMNREDVPQVILAEPSLKEILQLALSKQEPMQEEIRHKMMQRNEMEKYKQASDVKAELRLVV